MNRWWWYKSNWNKEKVVKEWERRVKEVGFVEENIAGGKSYSLHYNIYSTQATIVKSVLDDLLQSATHSNVSYAL